MCPPMAQANTSERIADHCANARCTQWSVSGWQKAHENKRVAGLGSFVLNLVGQRLTGWRWKRQDIDS